jgi:hypothetical protein
MADCNEKPDYDLSQGQEIGLIVTMSLLMATYGACFVFAVHNIVKHLVEGKRLKNWLLTSFYCLVVLICVFRILSLSLFLTSFLGHY